MKIKVDRRYIELDNMTYAKDMSTEEHPAIYLYFPTSWGDSDEGLGMTRPDCEKFYGEDATKVIHYLDSIAEVL